MLYIFFRHKLVLILKSHIAKLAVSYDLISHYIGSSESVFAPVSALNRPALVVVVAAVVPHRPTTDLFVIITNKSITTERFSATLKFYSQPLLSSSQDQKRSIKNICIQQTILMYS